MAQTSAPSPRRIAVIGAGIAGLACARTLRQAGHAVTVFEAAAQPGGRVATLATPFGSFDTGAQYFTVRDARLATTLQATAADLARRWSASAVRVLDDCGRVAEAARPRGEAHWVAVPSMSALPARWAEPLQADGALQLATHVQSLAPDALDARRWQLHTQGLADEQRVHAGFDAVVLALPAPEARRLLAGAPAAAALAEPLDAIEIAPCWNLSLAFPNASQPGTLGPQWNAARSTHHRVAWLTRESSKPGREPVERWTVQASHVWSTEHAGDPAARATAKLLKAFAEITGIRATPAWTEVRLWPQARTLRPLGQPFAWDARRGIGLCGDWCIGDRVEDAFVSGLELALRMLKR